MVVGQVPAETAFAQTAGKGRRIKREVLASSRNAQSAEHLWHGSSHGSLSAWMLIYHTKGKGYPVNVTKQYVFTRKILRKL